MCVCMCCTIDCIDSVTGIGNGPGSHQLTRTVRVTPEVRRRCVHVLFNALSKIAGTMAAYSCPLFKAIEAVLVDPSFSTGSAVAADALHAAKTLQEWKYT